MRLIFAPASLLVLTACAVPAGTPPGQPSQPGQSYERISFEGEFATPAERARCEAAGGTVERAGMRGWENCIQTFADGGKTCMDSSDCIGSCRTVGEFADGGSRVTGQCTSNDNVFGCYQTVEDGVAGPALCVD